MVPHVPNVMMDFKEKIVIHVPLQLVNVQHAHKMELHVIPVEVDSISMQTLVQLVQRL